MTITILQGDVVEQLRTLPDCSIDCIVTSPPYDNLRSYGNTNGQPQWDFKQTAVELHRTLRDGGVLCWNVNDSIVNGSETLTSFRQAIYFCDIINFKMHDTMIYERNGFSKPETTRYHQGFEYIFILSKGSPKTFNPIKDKKNKTAGQGTLGTPSIRMQDGSFKQTASRITNDVGMRTNVWKGNTRGQEAPCLELKHPAMMPTWLARDLIISFSNIGDMVLDPFGGSGTTPYEAMLLKRNATVIEINPDYIKDMRNYLRLNEQLVIE